MAMNKSAGLARDVETEVIKPVSRPSTISNKTKDKMLEMISNGFTPNEMCNPLNQKFRLAGLDPAEMPSARLFWRTLRSDPEFAIAVNDALQVFSMELAYEQVQVGRDQSRDPSCRMVEMKGLQFFVKGMNDKFRDKLDMTLAGVSGKPIETISATMTPELASQTYRKMIEGGKSE